MALKDIFKKKTKECSNEDKHLANLIVFKENKFQIDYQKILKCRDNEINEIQKN